VVEDLIWQWDYKSRKAPGKLAVECFEAIKTEFAPQKKHIINNRESLEVQIAAII
jgi:hypothetical protein